MLPKHPLERSRELRIQVGILYITYRQVRVWMSLYYVYRWCMRYLLYIYTAHRALLVQTMRLYSLLIWTSLDRYWYYTRAPLVVYDIINCVCVCTFIRTTILLYVCWCNDTAKLICIRRRHIILKYKHAHARAGGPRYSLAGRHSYTRRATKADTARRLFYHILLLCIGRWYGSL